MYYGVKFEKKGGRGVFPLHLDGLSLQQSLIEKLVELLFILLGIDHPLCKVPQPEPSARVREGWIHLPLEKRREAAGMKPPDASEKKRQT